MKCADLKCVGDRTHSAIAFIKGDMTKNMTMMFPSVHDEIKDCIDSQIGDCGGEYAGARRVEIECLMSQRLDGKERILARRELQSSRL